MKKLKVIQRDSDSSENIPGSSSVELTDNQKKQLEKVINKQKDFVNGNVKKRGKLTKKNATELKTIEASGMTYEDVGKEAGWNKKGTKCLVVKKLTQDLIDSNTLSILSTYRYSRWNSYNNEPTDGYVEEGIRLGTILGRKLQVRGESRETKWTRLDSGKIDKRLIAELRFW